MKTALLKPESPELSDGELAQRLVKLLVNADVPVKGARVGVLGITFKEDVTDIRNSRVPDIVRELTEFGISALVHDPIASAAEVKHEYGLTLCNFEELRALDAVVLAVSHKAYAELGIERIVSTLRDGGIVVDVKSACDPTKLDKRVRYWSL